MDYLTLYRRFLLTHTPASLSDLLRVTSIWERLQITSLDLVTEERLPYILATIGTHHHPDCGVFAATLTGVFLERERLGSLAPELHSDFFYMPVICRPSHLPPQLATLFPADLALAHELIHLEDIIQWIEEEPDYPDRVASHCLAACTPQTLEAGIDLEIRKVFRLEPRAIGHDFDHGEKLIVESGLFRRMMQYKCRTREEFIEHKVAAHVEALIRAFHQKFPSAREAIDRHAGKSLHRYGTALFGSEPEKRIEALQDEIVDKLLDGTIAAIEAASTDEDDAEGRRPNKLQPTPSPRRPPCP